jgi:hypothetical protein
MVIGMKIVNETEYPELSGGPVFFETVHTFLFA